jgi:hypothetical protein
MSGIQPPRGQVTSFWPSDFGTELTQTGYQMIGVANDSVTPTAKDKAVLRIQNYLCGNPSMSAANSVNYRKALAFWGSIRYVKIPLNNSVPPKLTTPETLAAPDFDLLAKGQGYPSDVCTILEHVWANRATFAKVIPKFANAATFQNMVDKLNDENILGLDCIGFVHQYLARVEIVSGYAGFKALQYLSYFKPITRLDEIAAGCICAWSNDSHIVIVDEVMEDISGGKRIAICQSSGSIKYGRIDVRPSGNFGDKNTPSAGKGPLNVLGVTLGSPRTFDLSNGDVPRFPNVVIGKLRNFVLS